MENAMIKFRCSNCGQKLGVPDKYAGRRVRCNKCNEPALVPRSVVAVESPSVKTAASPAKASPVKQEVKANAPAVEEPPQTDIFDGFDLQADDEEARRMEAIQIARQDRTTRKAKGMKFSPKSAKEKTARKSGGTRKEGFSIMAFADMVPPAMGFPLSLISSFLGVGIAIAIWIAAARSAGTTLGFFALLVFALGAFGLRLFMVNRTFLLGVLGLIIGLAGFGISKVAIGKYVIKDYYQRLSNEEILVNMDKILADAAAKDKGQTKSVKPFTTNGTYMLCTALLSLVDEGKADPVKARGWMIHMLKGAGATNTYTAFLGASPMPRLPDLTDEEEEIFGTAAGMLFEWDMEKKLLGKTKKYYPVLIKLIAQADHQEILADPKRSPKFCLVQAFGPLDAIWVLVGMGMTFIILTFD